MADKIYIGRIEKRETVYGVLTKIGINKSDIDKLEANLSERGWVNLLMKEKDGKQWLEIDQFKPDGSKIKTTENPPQEKDDLPY